MEAPVIKDNKIVVIDYRGLNSRAADIVAQEQAATTSAIQSIWDGAKSYRNLMSEAMFSKYERRNVEGTANVIFVPASDLLHSDTNTSGFENAIRTSRLVVVIDKNKLTDFGSNFCLHDKEAGQEKAPSLVVAPYAVLFSNLSPLQKRYNMVGDVTLDGLFKVPSVKTAMTEAILYGREPWTPGVKRPRQHLDASLPRYLAG